MALASSGAGRDGDVAAATAGIDAAPTWLIRTTAADSA
jgi:hypothetical protein